MISSVHVELNRRYRKRVIYTGSRWHWLSCKLHRLLSCVRRGYFFVVFLGMKLIVYKCNPDHTYIYIEAPCCWSHRRRLDSGAMTRLQIDLDKLSWRDEIYGGQGEAFKVLGILNVNYVGSSMCLEQAHPHGRVSSISRHAIKVEGR